MRTLTVCKGCGAQMQGQDSNGNPICVACYGIKEYSSIPVEVEMPEQFTCTECGVTTPTVELLKRWRVIPFADTKGHYYCGCRGWD